MKRFSAIGKVPRGSADHDASVRAAGAYSEFTEEQARRLFAGVLQQGRRASREVDWTACRRLDRDLLQPATPSMAGGSDVAPVSEYAASALHRWHYGAYSAKNHPSS